MQFYCIFFVLVLRVLYIKTKAQFLTNTFGLCVFVKRTGRLVIMFVDKTFLYQILRISLS